MDKCLGDCISLSALQLLSLSLCPPTYIIWTEKAIESSKINFKHLRRKWWEVQAMEHFGLPITYGI